MSSVGSNASTMVSFRGEEIDLDEALTALYREIQEQLNHSQSAVRQLACCEERNETFLEAVGIFHEIDDHVQSLFDLFKELQGVSKDCLGKCPPEYKAEYKKICEDRKALKQRQKNDAKELEKQMRFNVIQE